MVPKRKYHSDYIMVWFTSIEQIKECHTTMCNLCYRTYGAGMHLKTSHFNMRDPPPEHFAGNLVKLKKIKYKKVVQHVNNLINHFPHHLKYHS